MTNSPGKQPRFQTRPRGLQRLLFRLPIGLFRFHLGWLLGHRFLLLTHTGRKSGQARHTVLEVMRYDPVTRTHVGVSRKSTWKRL